MSTIIVHTNSDKELNLLEQILEKMNIRFEKKEEDVLVSDEMKKLIDERLKSEHKKLTPARDFIAKLKKDYGI